MPNISLHFTAAQIDEIIAAVRNSHSGASQTTTITSGLVGADTIPIYHGSAVGNATLTAIKNYIVPDILGTDVDYNQLADDVEQLQTDLDAAEAAAQTLSGIVGAHTTSLGTLVTFKNTVGPIVTQNTSDIEDLQDVIEDDYGPFKTMTNVQLDQFVDDIADVQNMNITQNTRLTSLENRVTALEGLLEKIQAQTKGFDVSIGTSKIYMKDEDGVIYEVTVPLGGGEFNFTALV